MTNFIAGANYALRSLSEAAAKFRSPRKTPSVVDPKGHDAPPQGSIESDIKDRKTDRNSAPADIDPISDFMSPHWTSDENYFQLSSGELHAMTDRFAEIMDMQMSTTAALEMLATKFLMLGKRHGVKPKKMERLYAIAMAHTHQSEQAQIQLEEIDQAIEARCEHAIQVFLGELGVDA